ncbi:DUF3140 domain-containing protein, partial [Paracraurococcus ruber]
MADSEDGAAQEFRALVNMDAAAMRRWLETEASREVGWQHEGEQESVGHQAGRRILDILEHAPAEEADTAFLHKVVGYIRRHLAQRPDGDIEHSRWRHSLMNWGHDPMQDSDTQQDREETAMPDETEEQPRAEEQPEAEPAPKRRRATGTRRSPAAFAGG